MSVWWSFIMFQLGFWCAVAFHHHMVVVARRNRKRWPP
jgi:hypothetical protein